MRFLLCWLFCSSAVVVFAHEVTNLNDTFRYPTYVGITGGYGSTTWEGLVPSASNQNMALSISTPIEVREGGGVWGIFAGYELTPYFALEASYMRYPDATIHFDVDSLFAFENSGELELKTHTETASLMAKLMLVIPNTNIRGYSSAGVARVQRADNMNNDWRVSPTFGLGLNYNITPRIMGEIGLNYTAGYGESELNPAKDYVPFLYSGALKVAYRF